MAHPFSNVPFASSYNSTLYNQNQANVYSTNYSGTNYGETQTLNCGWGNSLPKFVGGRPRSPVQQILRYRLDDPESAGYADAILRNKRSRYTSPKKNTLLEKKTELEHRNHNSHTQQNPPTVLNSMPTNPQPGLKETLFNKRVAQMGLTTNWYRLKKTRDNGLQQERIVLEIVDAKRKKKCKVYGGYTVPDKAKELAYGQGLLKLDCIAEETQIKQEQGADNQSTQSADSETATFSKLLPNPLHKAVSINSYSPVTRPSVWEPPLQTQKEDEYDPENSSYDRQNRQSNLQVKNNNNSQYSPPNAKRGSWKLVNGEWKHVTPPTPKSYDSNIASSPLYNIASSSSYPSADQASNNLSPPLYPPGTEAVSPPMIYPPNSTFTSAPMNFPPEAEQRTFPRTGDKSDTEGENEKEFLEKIGSIGYFHCCTKLPSKQYYYVEYFGYEIELWKAIEPSSRLKITGTFMREDMRARDSAFAIALGKLRQIEEKRYSTFPNSWDATGSTNQSSYNDALDQPLIVRSIPNWSYTTTSKNSSGVIGVPVYGMGRARGRGRGRPESPVSRREILDNREWRWPAY